MGIASDSLAQGNTLAWWDANVLSAANIVPATGLATDYLNVFNEAIMLFGLLPEMPDMIDELRAWQSLTYEQHFVRTGFVAAELAILAYQNADPSIKLPFDALSQATGEMVTSAVKRAGELLENPTALSDFVKATNFKLQSAIEGMDSLIHGGQMGGAQDDIDALFD